MYIVSVAVFYILLSLNMVGVLCIIIYSRGLAFQEGSGLFFMYYLDVHVQINSCTHYRDTREHSIDRITIMYMTGYHGKFQCLDNRRNSNIFQML